MKKILFFLSAALLLLAASCNRTPVSHTVEGMVYDATMNNIMLIADSGDTLNISTMDSDPQQVHGVMIDDRVRVTYTSEKMGDAEVRQAVSLEVLRHSPYFYISGTWVEPNPINPDAVQGVTLNPDGTASSVGMSTLLFKNWTLDLGVLTLVSESIGNKQSIVLTEDYPIVKLDADSLVLARPDGSHWGLGRQ